MKVVFLGCTDNYGYGFSANITKISYMVKGLTASGAECYIHNGICGNNYVTKEETKEIDGIPVTSLKKRWHEIVSWLFNIGKVFRYLRRQYNKDKKNVVIVEMDMYHIFLLYYLFCKIIGYKLVVISHEWGPTIVEVNKLRKPSIWIYTKTFGYLANGILPISEYIINKIKHFKKPYYKLPILAEFTEVESDTSDICNKNERTNLVYCASVYYKRIIMMILNAYKIYNNANGKLKLTLILNGPQNRLDDIQDEINKMNMQEYVIIKTRLPYNELLNEYATAAALIIPLDPECEQDEARFSQKIAEYLSSKSPIVTNNVGEIKYYFNDDEVIKCNYSEESFARTFCWIENNMERCHEIGINGYKKGKKEFDYKTKGEEMNHFFASLYK